ncbi:MAG: NFACT family protein [Clostridia bacterium]|nr:NFACT family protein [Clostridia bacterium]
MAYDAGMLWATLEEIKRECLGMRVEKVHQPTKDEVIFLLRGKRLSVNMGSSCPRIAITSAVKDNPLTPSMFCVLLRKHLSGAILREIEQCGYDRVARLAFSGFDEMGFRTDRVLYAELMGKYSNLVLTDGEGKILAVAKPIDFSDSQIRQLLPGLRYTLPPAQDKKDPRRETREGFLSSFSAYPAERGAVRFLTDTYGGTATVVAREVVFLASGGVDTVLGAIAADVLYDAMRAWFADLEEGRVSPSAYYKENGEGLAYGYRPYSHLSDFRKEEFSSLATLFDTYFGEKDRQERIHARAADMVRLVSHTEAKLAKKLDLQREELASSEKGEEYRRLGDLITGEIYRLKRGATSFEATDYSVDPPATVQVTLDSRLTPAANAQRYYKMYTKAKTAGEVLAKQVLITEAELAYIRSVASFLSRAETEADLAEIREELCRSGYGARMKKQASVKQLKARPLTFLSPGGYRILCGRNNLQNDLLTFRTAEKGDLWFHAKGVPGSHVILLCGGEEPADADYTYAAEIAAAFSSATGDHAEVDYTRVKNVKKPPAAKPGYVTYKTNYTAYVAVKKDLLKDNVRQKE